jgi:YbbR domain-containing protein
VNLRPQHPLQFLVALIAAFLLWYGLAADRSQNISQRGVKAPLTLTNIPRDLEIVTSSVPDTVSLQLKGPLHRALDPTNPPEVLLDLSEARPGISGFPINESDIPLPAEVQVVSIDPPAITLEFERLETRVVPIRPVLEGAPAEGYMVTGVRVLPAQFTIQGPESLILGLEQIDTSPISIEEASGPIETVVQPVLPDPLVRPLDLVSLQVFVDIAPEPEPDSVDDES